MAKTSAGNLLPLAPCKRGKITGLLMSNSAFSKAHLVLVLLFSMPSLAQSPAKKETADQDFSKEGAVIEQMTTKVTFQSDGTYTYDQRVRVRVQSDAGVRQYGILPFPYQASIGRVEVRGVQVTKPNGSVVATPLDSIQDVTSELYRDAPMYSDLREKHVAVKGLEPGDTLEYSVLWHLEKPLAKGQFWTSHEFTKNMVVLDEQLEISVPGERELKLKSQTVQPKMREESGRRIYLWKTSNLERVSPEEQQKALGYDAIRGLLPPPDVLISSFRNWEEVGRWYESLQQERVQPSPEVKAKAQELTKGLSDDDAKVRAIYNYVSLRYRYVAISFGIGRYQPHAAAEILGNQYGDCKDKHTLLAALLSAVGIRVYPALINARAAVDADVPSPGQFDHVISVVTKGSTLSWMDTTPEVTALGYLIYPLRGKPALVIMPDKIGFQTTPTNSPFSDKQIDTITAKLDADGTLRAHVEAVYRGDSELYFRYAFRRWPESQWKDLGQQMSYGARLGGTISNVRASPPERTEEPFTETYDYTLKDFDGGDKHRFVVPLPPFGIPEVKDEDFTRKTPLWLGFVGELQYESRIQFPKGWTATPPAPIDLKESFAEFQGSSEVREGVLITKRRLVLNASAVTPDQLTRYKAFQKAISDHDNSYIFLSHATADAAATTVATRSQATGRLGELLRQSISELPGSSNSEALQAEQDARTSMRSRDFTSANTALERAVSLDPTFSRAWVELGAAYAGARNPSSALNAFQKAAEADPKQIVPYKILAFVYMGVGKRDDAISTWQKVQTIAPDDPDLAANLGGLYLAQKRYAEAASFFQSAAKAKPADAYAQLSLGMARLRSHNTDQGLEALHKALEIDSGAEMLNDVAYEMAEEGTSLSDALVYSQRSLTEVEDRTQKVDLGNIQKTDLQLTFTIGAYWDTLGWIYFKMGDLTRAESCLNSAWDLTQDGVVGDHLGQLYEKEQKLPAALHMYNLALQANPRLEDTPERMRNLAHVHLPKNRMSAGEEISQMRTVKLPAITKESASAEFYIELGTSGKIEKVNFLRGSELLRDATESIKKTRFEEPLPPSSTAHLLREGIVSCSPLTGCSFVFYTPSVALRDADSSSGTPQAAEASSVGRQCGFSTPEAQLKTPSGKVSKGELIHRVEPEYPPVAREAHIQGVVVLCGTIAKDGTLRNLRASSGPEELVPSAIKAVAQWRYQPYLLDNEPVDVDSEILVSFTLSR
jgi:tetratricopeptide (TPR) repeat protein